MHCAGAADGIEDVAMRLVIDMLIVLMVVGMIGGGLYLHQQGKQSKADQAQVRDALGELHDKTVYHTNMSDAVAGRRTILVKVMPEWFGEDLPSNVLAGSDRPWIDLAPPGDRGVHPPDPVIHSESQAGFWYNPTLGIFRARVMPQASEGKTLALYNHLNDCELAEIDPAPDLARQPLAYAPGIAPVVSYASPAAAWMQSTGTINPPPAVVTQPQAIDPESLGGVEPEVVDLDVPQAPVEEVIPQDVEDLFAQTPAERPTLGKD